MQVFQHGKSYVWLFGIWFVFFIVVGMIGGHSNLAVLSMPAMIAFILACELQSGVALDSWWRASYRRGAWQYKALLIWHATAVVLLSIFAYVFVSIR